MLGFMSACILSIVFKDYITTIIPFNNAAPNFWVMEERLDHLSRKNAL